MSRNHGKTKHNCQVCGKTFAVSELYPVEFIGKHIRERIESGGTTLEAGGFVCKKDLADARFNFVHEMLLSERGELEENEKLVLESLHHEEELLSRDMYEEYDSKLSSGDRIADKVADFGGSWKFIISFMSVLFVWILINSIGLLTRPFDPFPFILLNLVLSCIAAIQAPVIMMSQNRKEAKDRLRSENDYRVNLKAELEIRSLQTKLDLLISHQWQRLLEIQEIQTVMLKELAAPLESRQK